jgi:hypothetical protein
MRIIPSHVRLIEFQVVQFSEKSIECVEFEREKRKRKFTGIYQGGKIDVKKIYKGTRMKNSKRASRKNIEGRTDRKY